MSYPLLAKRAATGIPIRVGVIGAGKFGAGVVAESTRLCYSHANAFPYFTILPHFADADPLSQS